MKNEIVIKANYGDLKPGKKYMFIHCLEVKKTRGGDFEIYSHVYGSNESITDKGAEIFRGNIAFIKTHFPEWDYRIVRYKLRLDISEAVAETIK